MGRNGAPAPRGRVLVRRQRHQRAPRARGAAGARDRSRRPRSAPSSSPRATRQGLLAQARKLRALASPSTRPDLADLGFSLATGRAHHGDARARSSRTTPKPCSAGLDARSRAARTSACSKPPRAPASTVFVFPGQGSQWEGMAAELLQTLARVRGLDRRLRDRTRALRRLVAGRRPAPSRGPGLERVDVVQPALFAVMVSLAALWRAHGVEPDAVVGHSQGEIAAAYVAGALTLDDAARVVALRSQADRRGARRPGRHGLDRASTSTRCNACPTAVSIAAVNGPRSVVVAGEDEALDALLEELHDAGVWVRRIPVDYPSHSPAVERLEERLLADLGPIAPVTSSHPLLLHARPASRSTPPTLDAAYWYRNLRQPVRFAPTIAQLLDDGASLFIEPSPHPVLTGAVNDTLDADRRRDRHAAPRRRRPRTLHPRAGPRPRPRRARRLGDRPQRAPGASAPRRTPSSASATG